LDLTSARDKKLSNYRNSYIGFVFQSFNLQTHETALENVIAPLIIGGKGNKKQWRELGMAALTKIGIADRAKHKPTELSGGQRQRVAIARALIKNPAIIIADEPTGNLDSARGKEVLGELIRLNAEYGITLIIITHDFTIANKATRVLTIRDGKLTENGTAL
jgi:putative ABC transport system ATP-binding protein